MPYTLLGLIFSCQLTSETRIVKVIPVKKSYQLSENVLVLIYIYADHFGRKDIKSSMLT